MGSNLFVSLGDPAGIGPEIILKAVLAPDISALARAGDCHIDLGVSPQLLKRECAFWGFELDTVDAAVGSYCIRGPSGLCPVQVAVFGDQHFARLASLGIHPDAALRRQALALLDGTVEPPHGEISAACALVACLSLCRAWEEAVRQGGTVVTAPINKESFRALGVPFPGHTEFLGALAGGRTGLTMFETRGLRIFFHSRHVSLRAACDLVTEKALLQSVLACMEALTDLGVDDPHLAVAGLNPHNGEHGLFGTEEEDWIRPAVLAAQARGLRVSGPIPADSVFHLAKTGRYDAVLSLYHDQGHIAAKTLDFERTVSLTLGLGVLRTSVDHGTAFDIAGQGIASSLGMEEAIRSAYAYSR